MPQKPLDVTPIDPPDGRRPRREARFAAAGERKSRYTLPDGLRSASPVGYRTRVSMTRDEAAQALALLSMARPTGFAEPTPPTEGELFEECSLGVLSARQSTNYRGFRQVTLGPERQAEVAGLLRRLEGVEAPPLDGASHCHLVIGRPYRNPFTLLLTLVGHRPITSLATVASRAIRKRTRFIDDIPTIG